MKKYISLIFLNGETKENPQTFINDLISSGTLMLLKTSLINKMMWFHYEMPTVTMTVNQQKFDAIKADFGLIKELVEEKPIFVGQDIILLTPRRKEKIEKILDFFSLKYKHENKKSNFSRKKVR